MEENHGKRQCWTRKCKYNKARIPKRKHAIDTVPEQISYPVFIDLLCNKPSRLSSLKRQPFFLLMDMDHLGWALIHGPLITGQSMASVTYFTVVWVLPWAMRVAGPYLSSSSSLAHAHSQYSGLGFQKQAPQCLSTFQVSVSCFLLSHWPRRVIWSNPMYRRGLT